MSDFFIAPLDLIVVDLIGVVRHRRTKAGRLCVRSRHLVASQQPVQPVHSCASCVSSTALKSHLQSQHIIRSTSAYFCRRIVQLLQVQQVRYSPHPPSRLSPNPRPLQTINTSLSSQLHAKHTELHLVSHHTQHGNSSSCGKNTSLDAYEAGDVHFLRGTGVRSVCQRTAHQEQMW